jgi:hypothetical protein
MPSNQSREASALVPNNGNSVDETAAMFSSMLQVRSSRGSATDRQIVRPFCCKCLW